MKTEILLEPECLPRIESSLANLRDNWQIHHFYSIFSWKLISIPHCRCYTANLPSNDQHVIYAKIAEVVRHIAEEEIEHEERHPKPFGCVGCRHRASKSFDVLLEMAFFPSLVLILEHGCICPPQKKECPMAGKKVKFNF